MTYQFAQGKEAISFTFCVTDPFVKWNEGTLGYKRAPELAELVLIRADEETIRLLDNVIIRKKPYISDYI